MIDDEDYDGGLRLIEENEVRSSSTTSGFELADCLQPARRDLAKEFDRFVPQRQEAGEQ